MNTASKGGRRQFTLITRFVSAAFMATVIAYEPAVLAGETAYPGTGDGIKGGVSGDARTQCELGRNYEFGDNPNPAKAAQCYRKSAEQGLARAQYNLARMYVDGEGVSRDYQQAVKWLTKAAAQNYVLAMNRLGVMYERGLGVSKDQVEAYKWYTLAAQAGNVSSSVNRDNLASRLTPVQVAEAELRSSTTRALEIASH
jgi:TPR repeat protein